MDDTQDGIRHMVTLQEGVWHIYINSGKRKSIYIKKYQNSTKHLCLSLSLTPPHFHGTKTIPIVL